MHDYDASHPHSDADGDTQEYPDAYADHYAQAHSHAHPYPYLYAHANSDPSQYADFLNLHHYVSAHNEFHDYQGVVNFYKYDLKEFVYDLIDQLFAYRSGRLRAWNWYNRPLDVWDSPSSFGSGNPEATS